jgi:hypothetical protein
MPFWPPRAATCSREGGAEAMTWGGRNTASVLPLKYRVRFLPRLNRLGELGMAPFGGQRVPRILAKIKRARAVIDGAAAA